MTPVAAIALAKAIRAKRSAATESDIRQLNYFAAAFSTEYDVQFEVCFTLGNLGVFGNVCSQRLIDLGGISTLLTIIERWQDNALMLFHGSRALLNIASNASPTAKRALVSTSGLVDTLKRVHLL